MLLGGVLGGEIEDFVFGECSEPASQRGAIGSQQQRSRLRGHTEDLPGDKRLVPQHREAGAVVVDEVIRLAKTVLRPEADYFDCVGVLSSELLDVGSFPSANWSMWGPHPHQNHFFGRNEVAQVDLVGENQIVDNNVGEDVGFDF